MVREVIGLPVPFFNLNPMYAFPVPAAPKKAFEAAYPKALSATPVVPNEYNPAAVVEPVLALQVVIDEVRSVLAYQPVIVVLSTHVPALLDTSELKSWVYGEVLRATWPQAPWKVNKADRKQNDCKSLLIVLVLSHSKY